MSRRTALILAAVAAAIVALAATVSGPPTCADLRGIENCPAAQVVQP